jgi:Zn-dependent protease
MPATVLNPEPALPQAIHNCPNCSHWLPDGTLACPDCQTLTYGNYLSEVAGSAQALEQQGQWAEARERWKSALSWLPEGTQQAAVVQQRIALIDRRFQAAEDQKARWTKRLGPFAPIALFLIKAKSFLFLAFKLKFLISLFAFFGIYWALFGWKFALGFTACLGIHELGHYVAVRRRGLRADLPVFFPGLGAYVKWYSRGVSLDNLAAIALAGPLYGLVAALGCMAVWKLWPLEIFLVLANVGAYINLLNLLPILGLDGAQATYALSRLQRGLIAATCFLFFGLTVSASGGDLMGANTQWVFAIVGAGLLWRCFTRDVPEKPHTGTMIYFMALVLALGFLLLSTLGPIAVIAQNAQQPVGGYWF